MVYHVPAEWLLFWLKPIAKFPLNDVVKDVRGTFDIGFKLLHKASMFSKRDQLITLTPGFKCYLFNQPQTGLCQNLN